MRNSINFSEVAINEEGTKHEHILLFAKMHA